MLALTRTHKYVEVFAKHVLCKHTATRSVCMRTHTHMAATVDILFVICNGASLNR